MSCMFNKIKNSPALAEVPMITGNVSGSALKRLPLKLIQTKRLTEGCRRL